jgi:energy-coupling factor transporter ATP-binding protein EcfA2
MAAVRGVPATRVDEWAQRLGFAGLLDTRLPDLSKGSAHKAGLIQALLAAPGLLVLDEPFAGLDARTRAALPALLAELAARGSSVVVSDHQGDLRSVPGVVRWQVAEQTVVSDADLPEEHAVVEVIVPRSQAEDLVGRLKAEGYEARCR